MKVSELKALIEASGVPDDADVLMEFWDENENEIVEREVARASARIGFREPSSLIVRFTNA